jgi:hypothetical protein
LFVLLSPPHSCQPSSFAAGLLSAELSNLGSLVSATTSRYSRAGLRQDTQTQDCVYDSKYSHFTKLISYLAIPSVIIVSYPQCSRCHHSPYDLPLRPGPHCSLRQGEPFSTESPNPGVDSGLSTGFAGLCMAVAGPPPRDAARQRRGRGSVLARSRWI